MTKIRVKCGNCGTEFEVTEDDLDIDYEVERFDKNSVEITITVTVRCVKCGRRVIHGIETVSVPLKVLKGEIL